MAQILAPLFPSNSHTVEELILNGADAFFMGIVNRQNAYSLTRRPQFENAAGIGFSNANFLSTDNYGECIDLLHAHNKKVYLTLNEHYYNPSDYSFILNSIANWSKIVDGFIVSDISLLKNIKQNNAQAIASTGTHVFNKESIRFLYGSGCSAIVLPRVISKKQAIEFATAFPEITFEYFVFNDFCYYVDGLCRTLHGPPFLPVCIHQNALNTESKYKIFGCRICNLFELLKLKNIVLKIAGRGHDTDMIFKNVKLLNILRNKVDTFNCENDFKNFAQQEYQKLFETTCTVNCKKDD